MPPILFLFVTAAAVAIVHSILPDHWVPIAVVARTQRWSLGRVAKVSFLAAVGHVLTSILLGGVIALIGLQFQRQLDTIQGRVVGGVLFVTGLGFLLWSITGHGHHHDEDHAHEDHHPHDHEHVHTHSEAHSQPQQAHTRRVASLVVPFGVAASPDLTFLPVALAASVVGRSAVVGVLVVFSVITLATFVGLTMLATLVGYQVKGAWLEQHANTLTALVLMGIGLVAYIGF